MSEIELGDTVKCKYTGFKGIAVAKTEYINGCVQFSIASRVGKDNKLERDEICIDSQSLIVVKKKPKDNEDDEDDTGGPSKIMTRRRNY